MNENFTLFKSFSSLEQAQELKKLLEQNVIEVALSDNIPHFDPTFSGNTTNQSFDVYIHPQHFEMAEKLLEDAMDSYTENMDKNYYLYTFSDEELYEVLIKYDEWNAFDVNLAKKILSQRSKPMDQGFIDAMKNKRLLELAQPEKNQTVWILIGYIMAFFGGIFGLMIGHFLWTSFKTLPNGEKVFTYTSNIRKHGKFIFYIGTIMIVSFILIALLKGISF